MKKSRLDEELTKYQTVILHYGFNNASKVMVVKQSPNKLYTTVTSNGVNEWDVMTYRLSVI